MAEIIANEGGGKQKGKRRSKRHSTHIDMTPMVDLACLLLTFFMLTTAFNKPKVMEIVLPEKPKPGEKIETPEIPPERALTIILIENNRVLWYAGLADPRKPPLPVLNETDFSDDGIRKVLLRRNRELFAKIDEMNTDVIEGKLDIPRDTIEARRRKMLIQDKAGPVVLIKAGNNVKYRNIVDIIDEMAITNMARYALTDVNDVEKKMVADYLASNPSGAASNK
jgi:biopolymer transport protein ExbD